MLMQTPAAPLVYPPPLPAPGPIDISHPSALHLDLVDAILPKHDAKRECKNFVNRMIRSYNLASDEYADPTQRFNQIKMMMIRLPMDYHETCGIVSVYRYCQLVI